MDWLQFIILGLVTQLLVTLWFGRPFFVRLREKLGSYASILTNGVNCGLCVSIWAGAMVYLTWLLVPYSQYGLTALAVGSLALFINSTVRMQ